MMQFRKLIGVLLLLVVPVAWAESYDDVPLLKAPINLADLPSLQRGAKMYINYCSGCHSLNFMRYNRLASDIGIEDKQVVKDSLIFTGAKITDTLQIAMQKEDAKSWFGVTPPDLSVIARARSADWLYTYLLSFYQDNSRPWGVNNLVFNETAMPDVLANLRGVQAPIYSTKTLEMDGVPRTIKVIDHLALIEHGEMYPEQFNAVVGDLVNFLVYVGEPSRREREHLGLWVIEYLLIFAVLAYLLKRAYWKYVK